MAAFTNKATLSYNGVVTESNTVTGELVGTMTVAKTALRDTYSPGDTVSYIITLKNTGTNDVSGVTLTDSLGAFEFGGGKLCPLTADPDSVKLFVNGELQPAPQVEVNEGLVVSGLTVPAGGSAVVAYSALVNSHASPEPGASIVNSVSVGSANTQRSSEASATVTAESEPRLTVAKSLCPAQVPENGSITYTFTIENSGGSEAGADAEVVLSDTFAPVLSNLAAELDGAPLEAGTGYTYDEATGEFATLPGVITVPAAAFTQDETTGEWTTAPGSVTLTVTGTV